MNLKNSCTIRTAFQHVSMVDSTIIRAVPPARTKTLLLQTFYHIMHTHRFILCSHQHRCAALLKLPGTMGIQKVGVGIRTIVCVYRVFVCVCVFVCLFVYVMPTAYVHSVQQKSSGLKCTFCSGSDVTYSCHYNLSGRTFPMFVHSWCFCLPFIMNNHTMYMLTKDTNTFA
jgi:hypothetical protein